MGDEVLPPFSLAEVVTRWQFAPIITAFAVITAGLYLWGVLRVRRRHPARPWPLYRTALLVSTRFMKPVRCVPTMTPT